MKVQSTNLEKLCLSASIALAAGMFIYVFTLWDSLPQKLPTHFDFSGQADAWGGKESIWLLPTIYLGMVMTSLFIRKFPERMRIPLKQTGEQKRRTTVLALEMVSILNLQLGLMFIYIIDSSVHGDQSSGYTLGTWFVPMVLFVTLGTIAIYFVRMRSPKT